MIEEQYKLFKQILKRDLTEDEKYLIKNAFQNGLEQGKKIGKDNLIDTLLKTIY